jgi:hypothetical protein
LSTGAHRLDLIDHRSDSGDGVVVARRHGEAIGQEDRELVGVLTALHELVEQHLAGEPVEGQRVRLDRPGLHRGPERLQIAGAPQRREVIECLGGAAGEAGLAGEELALRCRVGLELLTVRLVPTAAEVDLGRMEWHVTTSGCGQHWQCLVRFVEQKVGPCDLQPRPVPVSLVTYAGSMASG